MRGDLRGKGHKRQYGGIKRTTLQTLGWDDNRRGIRPCCGLKPEWQVIRVSTAKEAPNLTEYAKMADQKIEERCTPTSSNK